MGGRECWGVEGGERDGWLMGGIWWDRNAGIARLPALEGACLAGLEWGVQRRECGGGGKVAYVDKGA